MVVFGSRMGHSDGRPALRAANRIGDTLQGPLVNPMMGLLVPSSAKSEEGIKQGESKSTRAIIRTAPSYRFHLPRGRSVSQDVACATA